jgi:hypothetical protein
MKRAGVRAEALDDSAQTLIERRHDGR